RPADRRGSVAVPLVVVGLVLAGRADRVRVVNRRGGPGPGVRGGAVAVVVAGPGGRVGARAARPAHGDRGAAQDLGGLGGPPALAFASLGGGGQDQHGQGGEGGPAEGGAHHLVLLSAARGRWVLVPRLCILTHPGQRSGEISGENGPARSNGPVFVCCF